MASINLSGVLYDPLGDVSYKNKFRFTHETTTGQTVAGFSSQRTIEVNGAYDFDLEYGNVLVESRDYNAQRWVSHGVVTVNSDTPAIDIPTLIGITTPATDAQLLVFQALAADAAESANSATASASSALLSSEESEQYLAGINSILDDRLLPESIVDLPLTSGKLINKLNGALTINRNTESTVINASGELVTVAVDEPMANGKGVGVFGALTNLVAYSEDFSQWTASATTPFNSIEQLETRGAKLTSGGSAGRIDSFFSPTSGVTSFVLSVIGATAGAEVAIGDGVSPSVFLKTTLTGGRQYIALNVEQSDSFSIDSFLILLTSNAFIDVEYAQVFDGKGLILYPYIPTQATAVTRGADSISFPMQGNFPATGSVFSFAVDIDGIQTVWSFDGAAYTKYENQLEVTATDFLAEFQVGDEIVFPASNRVYANAKLFSSELTLNQVKAMGSAS